MITQLVVLLDYLLFKEHYKLVATDFSRKQALDADPKAIQRISFTGNIALEGNANATMFFIIEEAQETILDFSQATVRVL